MNKCKDCKWWDDTEWDKKLKKGNCKRYAPLHFDIQGYRWPCTTKDDRCGEFEAKE